VAVPEIARLTDQGKVSEAFDLAAEARRYLSEDTRQLAELRPLFSRAATIRSGACGCGRALEEYSAPASEWRNPGSDPARGRGRSDRLRPAQD